MFNVLIRPLEVNDAFLSWKWRNDSDIWLFTGKKPDRHITYEIEKEWIEKVIEDSSSKRFAILVDDKYVGNIQLTNIVENESAEYHIFIGDKEYWSKGIGTLATYQLIRYSKNTLNLKEIYLFVNPDNINAIKLYERCDFKKVNDDIKMSLNLLNSFMPTVSIFMMVYNHGEFLEDALKGILFQKCSFDFEIVIGEDKSQDNSKKILLDFSERFSGKFKLLLNEKNIGPQKNQTAVLENCTGKYIAMCEGDDYWTDPLKLQKQVDFLEVNPEYVLCFHKVNVLKVDGEIVEDFITKVPDNYESIITLAKMGNYIHTPSVVFRNVIRKFPFEFELSPVGDYFLYMMLAEKGKLKYIDESMAIYRHGVGIHSSNSIIKNAKNSVNFFICLLSYLKDDELKKYVFERQITATKHLDELIASEKESFFLQIIKKIKNFIKMFKI